MHIDVCPNNVEYLLFSDKAAAYFVRPTFFTEHCQLCGLVDKVPTSTVAEGSRHGSDTLFGL